MKEMGLKEFIYVSTIIQTKVALLKMINPILTGILNVIGQVSMKGKLFHSSCVRIIRFLHKVLKLHELHFLRFLATIGCVIWDVGDCLSGGPDSLPGSIALTFKERVERYVVEGGEFPLPRPLL